MIRKTETSEKYIVKDWVPNNYPVDARRRFNVYKTSIQRRIDVL